MCTSSALMLPSACDIEVTPTNEPCLMSESDALTRAAIDGALHCAEQPPDALVCSGFDRHCWIFCRRLHREPLLAAARWIALPRCGLLHVDRRRDSPDVGSEVPRALIDCR